MVFATEGVNMLPMRVSPRFRWIAGAALGVVLMLGVAVVPMVRARIQREAAARHLVMEVGTVLPGWFSIHLRGVRVSPEGAPDLAVSLDRVDVDLGANLRPSHVSVVGGNVALVGIESEIRDRWISRKEESERGEPGRAHTEIHVEGITVTWQRAPGEHLRLEGVSLDRSAEWSARVSEFHVERGSLSFAGKGASATVLQGGVLRALDVDEWTVGYVIPVSKEAAPIDPVPAPPSPEPAESGALFSIPDPKRIFADAKMLSALVAPRLSDSAEVRVKSMYFSGNLRGDAVHIGPGHLNVSRALDKVHVAFSTEQGEGVTPLRVTADFPATSGDTTVVLDGGPVPLALLGVKEGMAGLTDIGKGSVRGRGRLTASLDATTFDVALDLRGISIKQPRLAADTLRGLDLAVSARGALSSPRKLRIDDAEVRVGEMKLGLRGSIASAEDHSEAAMTFEIRRSSCQSLLESVPSALLPIVRNAKMNGVFAASGRLSFDTRDLDALALETNISDECKMTAVPEDLARERFLRTFTHRIFHPDGTMGEETTGRGSDTWTDIGAISPFMQVAVLTTEDGAFFRHKGFNHAAIRSSLAANLKSRKFVRGASTISMQLAKNLFLGREKTLSRKLEEIVLTDYLEQVWTKDEILELYFNIVEFGPDIYGITAAADHYFGRKPYELNLAECLFLATLLPSPVRYHRMWEKGEVPEHWLKNIRHLMVIAEKNGKITPGDLQEGLKQPITFYKSGVRPTPRAPVVDRRIPQDEMDAWQPLP